VRDWQRATLTISSSYKLSWQLDEYDHYNQKWKPVKRGWFR
jgi:hypothetical protein